MASCATDLKCYVLEVAPAARADLCRQLQLALPMLPEFGKTDSANDLHCLRQHLCFHQVQHWLGMPIFETSDQAEQYAGELVQLFAASQPQVAGLDAKERGHADELLVLAAAALISAAECSNSPSSDRPRRLLQALLVVEAGQQKRHVSAPLRLTACFLSSLLVAPTIASNQAGPLEIKHIMHDSVSGHVLLPGLLGAGSSDEAASLLEDMLSLYSDHERDAGDTLMMAYEAGSWTKVIEFVAFGEQLRKSHTRALAQTELCLLNLELQATKGQAKSASQNVQELPQPGDLPDVLEFHEDLAVRPAWMPPSTTHLPLSLLGWWESRTSRCAPEPPWWVVARSSASLKGASWRDGSIENLRARHLLASLLAGLKSSSSDSPCGASDEQDLLDCKQMDSSAAETYTGDSHGFMLLLTRCLQQSQKSRSDREMDSTESASSTANGNSRTAAFAESLRDIAAAFGGLCETAERLLSPQGPAQPDVMFLHCHGLLAAAALAHQQAIWMALVLPCWRKSSTTSYQSKQEFEVHTLSSLLCDISHDSVTSLQKVQARLQAIVDASRDGQAAAMMKAEFKV
ncbi:hypothetical protein WJX84_007687 [Apatococcus fuscideae]|uniref:Uncharacterized protein n=1 Tax=Apatococcus fuscideae TaxID=2026836 RepID=A0AAW1TG84_9CHLO